MTEDTVKTINETPQISNAVLLPEIGKSNETSPTKFSENQTTVKSSDDDKHVEIDKTETANIKKNATSNAFPDTKSLQEGHKQVIFEGGSDQDLLQDNVPEQTRSEIEIPEIELPQIQHLDEHLDTSIETERYPSICLISEDIKKKTQSQKKKSIVSYSMGYNFANRFYSFRQTVSDIPPDVTAGVNLIETLESNLEEEEEETEEEETTISTASVLSASRSFLYGKHKDLSRELNVTKMCNRMLQKKLALYFRQKNMRHVLKREDVSINILNKYKTLLNKFEEICIEDRHERGTIEHQIESMQRKKDTTKIELKRMFKDFQDRERTVGCGLIHSKTGTEISERYIDHLISRQRTVKKNICEMRLTWIQLKTMVEEKENAITAIDKIDETHSLTDYEKLKTENFTRIDKLEEKEQELSKLRLSTQKTIQIVAHLREKISAMSTDINDLEEIDQRLRSDFDSYRSRLAHLKMERDSYRRSIIKSKEESGLLTHNSLLKDMEKCMEEDKHLQKQLKSLQGDCKAKTKQVKVLRLKLQEQREDKSRTRKEFNRESVKCKRNISVAKSNILQRVPSTFKVKLPEGVLDFIEKEFLPKVTRIKFDDVCGSSAKSINKKNRN